MNRLDREHLEKFIKHLNIVPEEVPDKFTTYLAIRVEDMSKPLVMSGTRHCGYCNSPVWVDSRALNEREFKPPDIMCLNCMMERLNEVVKSRW